MSNFISAWFFFYNSSYKMLEFKYSTHKRDRINTNTHKRLNNHMVVNQRTFYLTVYSQAESCICKLYIGNLLTVSPPWNIDLRWFLHHLPAGLQRPPWQLLGSNPIAQGGQPWPLFICTVTWFGVYKLCVKAVCVFPKAELLIEFYLVCRLCPG